MSGLAWRAAAIESGELFITREYVRVVSSPSRAAALVGKLRGTLGGVTWRKGILFAEGNWVLTLYGFRNAREPFVLSVTFKEVSPMVAIDPQGDGFTAACRVLNLKHEDIERLDRHTPAIPWRVA